MKQEEALRIVSMTREEFDKAVHKALERTMEDAFDKIGPSGAFIIPLVNTLFARELRNQLFPEEVGEDAADSAR